MISIAQYNYGVRVRGGRILCSILPGTPTADSKLRGAFDSMLSGELNYILLGALDCMLLGTIDSNSPKNIKLVATQERLNRFTI